MRHWATWLFRLVIASCVIIPIVHFRFSQHDYPYYARQRAEAAAAIAKSPYTELPAATAGGEPDLETTSLETAPLEIAVVWPKNGPQSFLRGIHQAVEKINGGGGVRQTAEDGRQYKRNLHVRYFNEQSATSAETDDTAWDGTAIARRIARDRDILAVVGHSTESIMPASVVYHESGVLFVAPTNMDRRVTLHRFENVFRTAPRYRQVAKAMVDAVTHIGDRKQIRLAVLYPSLLNKTPADVIQELTGSANAIIESFGDKVDFNVTFAAAYDRQKAGEFRKVIAPFLQWESRYDMILIMDVQPYAKILRQELSDGFSRVKQDPAFQKPTRDLNGLDWTGEQALSAEVAESLQVETLFDQAAAYVLSEARQDVVILASSDSYGKSLGAQIRSHVANTQDHPVNALNLEMYRAFGTSTESYLSVVSEVLRTNCEFVFVAGTGDAAVELINQLRRAGLDRPIFCGPDLEHELITAEHPDSERGRVRPIIDDIQLGVGSKKRIEEWLVNENPDRPTIDQLIRQLRKRGYIGSEATVKGYVAERKGRTYVASVFNHESLSPKVSQFVKAYQDHYPEDEVDALAAQGYHAIYLLQDAFQRGGSTAPKTTAAALRLFVEDDGILGKNHFSVNGDLQGLEIIFKQRAAGKQVNVVRLNQAAPHQPAP